MIQPLIPNPSSIPPAWRLPQKPKKEMPAQLPLRLPLDEPIRRPECPKKPPAEPERGHIEIKMF